MTTRSDIKNIMAYMGMAFPNYHPLLGGDVNAVDVLFDLLGDLPTDTLKTAVQACCAEPGRAFAPSAGEIRGMAVQMHAQATGLPSAGEAWAAVMASYNCVTSQIPEAYHHPLIQEAVRQMGGRDIIGASENVMAERAHFLKIYQSIYERELTNVGQLPQVTGYIEAKRMSVGGEIKRLADTLGREVRNG